MKEKEKSLLLLMLMFTVLQFQHTAIWIIIPLLKLQLKNY